MRRRIAIAASVLVAVLPLTQRARAGARTPCAGVARGVVVDTQSRTLALCADGATVETFRVALGVGGLGKQRQGDNRTPLGDYALGAPRTSKWFGMFIPVGYPTAAQERAGFTGNAIGIHGPARGWAWAGAANTISDWTAGCIAVGSDAEIGRIAAWVKARRPVGVHIE